MPRSAHDIRRGRIRSLTRSAYCIWPRRRRRCWSTAGRARGRSCQRRSQRSPPQRAATRCAPAPRCTPAPLPGWVRATLASDRASALAPGAFLSPGAPLARQPTGPAPSHHRPAPQALNCLVGSFPAVADVAAAALGPEAAQEALSPAIVQLLRTQLVRARARACGAPLGRPARAAPAESGREARRRSPLTPTRLGPRTP